MVIAIVRQALEIGILLLMVNFLSSAMERRAQSFVSFLALDDMA